MKNALICIASPLQAICAVEAISVYEIDKYELFVIGESTRLSQMEIFLNERDIVYTVIPYHVSLWKNLARMIGLLNPFRGKYDMLLMGDYRLTSNRMEYVPLVKSGGEIVYLDDGAYIIGWSKGLMLETKITKLRNWLMDKVCGLRRISDKNIFTMFSRDVVMHDYLVRENTLSQFQLSSTTQGNEIYFIGTNPIGKDGYCMYMGIDYAHYLNVIEKVLTEIALVHPHAHIMYIPHGRDRSKETVEICNRLNVEYRPLSECVELYVLSQNKYPMEVWGVGSTALYTLRYLCRDTKVVNVLIQGSNSNSLEEYRGISDIYTRNNIETVWIE